MARLDMYGRILVPLDGSKLAEGVLPHVAEVVRGRESHVFLLAVVPLMWSTTATVPGVSLPSSVPQEEKVRVEQALRAYLETVTGLLAPVAAGVQVAVRFGRAADEILTFADVMDADLIAMSAHGLSGIRRWVFGGVADRVLHAAACAVLLIRPERAPGTPVYRRVLVPLDGSELAEQVLPHVMALVSPGQTRVSLISVLASGIGDRAVSLMTSYPPGLQLSTSAMSKAEAEMQVYLRSVAAALRERGAVVRTVVRKGLPAEEVLAHAAEMEADLIAMSAHGRSGVSRWVFGNVAGKVLHGAPCAVLLVRRAGEEGDSQGGAHA